jgi:hypothetical protein
MSVLVMSDHTEVTPHSFGLAVRQTVAMAKRSTLEIFRQPALVAPSMIFPIFFAALGASSFGKTTDLPGFPKVDSFLQFSIAATVVQGVLFGSVTGAAALATDIQNGFFDRLLLSPTTRTGILIGRLAGSAIFGALQAAFFIAVLWPFGGKIESGFIGIAIMVVSGGIVALAIGALMSSVAIRTGSAKWCRTVLAPAWVRAGYRSEDGLLRRADGTVVPARTEPELFRLIGLKWVHPRDREVTQ